VKEKRKREIERYRGDRKRGKKDTKKIRKTLK
jgi:hypothetical protein